LQPRKAMFLLNSRIPRVSPVLARQSQWFSRGCPSVLPISLTGPAICTGLRTRESCCGWYDREGVLYQAAALPLPRTVRSAPRRQAPAARTQPETHGRPCPREAGRSRPPHFCSVASPSSRKNEPDSVHCARDYYFQDLRRRRLHTRPPACLAAVAAPAYRTTRLAARSALNFRAPRIRQVRCNTLLSGCRPPWPPPCCPDPRARFVPASGRLTPAGFFAPRSACLPHAAHLRVRERSPCAHSRFACRARRRTARSTSPQLS